VVRGQELYNEQCASCHFVSIEGYGPALGSISKRLPEDWLVSFIRNSQEVIRSGDPYANFIYEQFDRKVMVAMEFLSDEDVRDIISYIDFVSSSAPEVAGVNGKKIARADPRVIYNTDDVVQQHRDKPYMSIIFIVVTGFAAIIHTYLVIRLFLYLKR
jgi:cytochrome c